MNCIKKVKKVYYKMRWYLMYREAVKKSEQASMKLRKLVFVLPTESGKLMLMTYQDFKNLKKTKVIGKDYKPNQLFKECVYHTNIKSKKGKENHYEKWVTWMLQKHNL